MSPAPAGPAVLSEQLLREIAANGRVQQFPAHAVLISEGDTVDSLFIILAGRVKVYASNASGKEVILNQHGPGEYVGELTLDGGARSASVMTLEPTRCAIVTGATLREFVASHPDFALHLIHHLIRRVRALTANVKSLALDDVYQRVIALIDRLAVGDGERTVPDKLTQQDIAERVGASREMVSRIFKELTIGGYVVVRAGRIVLLKKPPAQW